MNAPDEQGVEYSDTMYVHLVIQVMTLQAVVARYKLNQLLHCRPPSIDDLITRANTLLDEISRFKEHAASNNSRQRNVPMRDYEGGIRSEIDHLSKVARSIEEDTAAKTSQAGKCRAWIQYISS